MFVAAGGAAIEDRDNDNPIELGIDEKRSTAQIVGGDEL